MNIGVVQIKAASMMSSISKITPGNWCFFANYRCLFFLKKFTNWSNLTNFCVTSNMFHHKFKENRNKFPNKMSFHVKPNPPLSQPKIFIEHSTNPFFGNFFEISAPTPHPHPLNKGEDFPAVTSAHRLLIQWTFLRPTPCLN